MTGALLRLRPNLPAADLKICDETIPAFDGKLRFNLVLEPKRAERESKARRLTAIRVLRRCAG